MVWTSPLILSSIYQCTKIPSNWPEYFSGLCAVPLSQNDLCFSLPPPPPSLLASTTAALGCCKTHHDVILGDFLDPLDPESDAEMIYTQLLSGFDRLRSEHCPERSFPAPHLNGVAPQLTVFEDDEDDGDGEVPFQSQPPVSSFQVLGVPSPFGSEVEECDSTATDTESIFDPASPALVSRPTSRPTSTTSCDSFSDDSMKSGSSLPEEEPKCNNLLSADSFLSKEVPYSPTSTASPASTEETSPDPQILRRLNGRASLPLTLLTPNQQRLNSGMLRRGLSKRPRTILSSAGTAPLSLVPRCQSQPAVMLNQIPKPAPHLTKHQSSTAKNSFAQSRVPQTIPRTQSSSSITADSQTMIPALLDEVERLYYTHLEYHQTWQPSSSSTSARHILIFSKASCEGVTHKFISSQVIFSSHTIREWVFSSSSTALHYSKGSHQLLCT